MKFQKVQVLHTSRDTNFYRKTKNGFLLGGIWVILQLFILCSEAYYIDSNPYRHKEILGPNSSFVVEWSVNWMNKTIMFQVSATTLGWVGFGLSSDGRMIGSDVVIGGIGGNGKPYFYDAHVENREPEVDTQQNWKLLGAWEKGNRTYLSFSRPFDTCDPQDYAITKDLVVLIWAYGDSDKVQYHMKRRGSVPVYLLDPSISDEIAHHHYRQIGPHSNLYLVQRWALTNTVRLSAKPTSVWCSIHRGPRLLLRHDIVGMGSFLPTKAARKHVQKILVYRCTAPQQTQANTFFEPYTEIKGEECYVNERRTLPLNFCRELLYVWGKGGKPFYFPEDIGIPIGESQNEFFLLETYYDNPKTRHDLEFESGVEFSFSHRQKPNSASILQIGYGPFGTFMIPPKSVMNIFGSCGSKCTSSMLPSNGVVVFAVMLHARSLGRGVRLRHFRNDQELPWIIKDDNYDSEFQQMRLMSKLVTILPGDHLTTQCTYDSSEKNRTVFSGFSTQDESCLSYLYITTRIPYFRCTSEYPADKLLSRYGVQNFTWDLVWQDRYVTLPKKLEGHWIGDVVDGDGSSHKRSINARELQEELQLSPHVGSCPNIYDVMGNTQNQMFKTFTNKWTSEDSTPVSVETPYASTSVSYPQNAREFEDSPVCHSGGPSYKDIKHEIPEPLSFEEHLEPAPFKGPLDDEIPGPGPFARPMNHEIPKPASLRRPVTQEIPGRPPFREIIRDKAPGSGSRPEFSFSGDDNPGLPENSFDFSHLENTPSERIPVAPPRKTNRGKERQRNEPPTQPPFKENVRVKTPSPSPRPEFSFPATPRPFSEFSFSGEGEHGFPEHSLDFSHVENSPERSPVPSVPRNNHRGRERQRVQAVSKDEFITVTTTKDNDRRRGRERPNKNKSSVNDDRQKSVIGDGILGGFRGSQLHHAPPHFEILNYDGFPDSESFFGPSDFRQSEEVISNAYQDDSNEQRNPRSRDPVIPNSYRSDDGQRGPPSREPVIPNSYRTSDGERNQPSHEPFVPNNYRSNDGQREIPKRDPIIPNDYRNNDGPHETTLDYDPLNPNNYRNKERQRSEPVSKAIHSHNIRNDDVEDEKQFAQQDKDIRAAFNNYRDSERHRGPTNTIEKIPIPYRNSEKKPERASYQNYRGNEKHVSSIDSINDNAPKFRDNSKQRQPPVSDKLNAHNFEENQEYRRVPQTATEPPKSNYRSNERPRSQPITTSVISSSYQDEDSQQEVLVGRGSSIPSSQTTNTNTDSATSSSKTSDFFSTGQPIKDFFEQLANMISPSSSGKRVDKFPFRTVAHSQQGMSFQNMMDGKIVSRRTNNIKLVRPSTGASTSNNSTA